MKQRVYVETSVISYLAARLSRDLIVAAKQQITQEWWKTAHEKFDLFVSASVMKEISAGDHKVAEVRKSLTKQMTVLETKEEVVKFARALVEKGPLPAEAFEDALHIAFAACNGMEYLVTWNCGHIANAIIRKSVENISAEFGFICPTICTPEELMGGI